MKSLIFGFALAVATRGGFAAPFLKPYTEPPIPHTHHHGDHYHGERGAYESQHKVDLESQRQLSYDSVKKTQLGGGHGYVGSGYDGPSGIGHGSPGLSHVSPSLSHTPGGFGSPSFSQGPIGVPHKDIGSPSFSHGSGGDYGLTSLGQQSGGYGQSGAGSFSQSSAGSFSQSSTGSVAHSSSGVQSGLSHGSGIGHGSGLGHSSGLGHGSGLGLGSGLGHQSALDYGHQTKLDHDLKGVGLVGPGHRIDSVGDRYAKRDEEHVRTGSSSFSTSYSSSNAGADSYKESTLRRY